MHLARLLFYSMIFPNKKMKKFNITAVLFVVFILLVSIPVLVAQQTDDLQWKLSKDQDGIKVYTRKVKGYKLKEFKAITTVNASPETLLAVIREVDKYPEWISHIEDAYAVEKVSNDEVYVYTETKLPWPFSNRDIVTHSKLYWEGDTAFVKMTGVSDFIPKNKGVVRIPFSYGTWTYKPIRDGLTEILYQFQGDPGGNIPGWLANMFIIDGPFKTIVRLKEVSESNTGSPKK